MTQIRYFNALSKILDGDSSLTRQFTDMHFEVSSLTKLITVTVATNRIDDS